jgi:3-oxoacyl-[acyl-carrier-protein] synthase III
VFPEEGESDPAEESPAVDGRWQYASNNFADVIQTNLQILLGPEAAAHVVAVTQSDFVSAVFELHEDGRYSNIESRTGTWSISEGAAGSNINIITLTIGDDPP